MTTKLTAAYPSTDNTSINKGGGKVIEKLAEVTLLYFLYICSVVIKDASPPFYEKATSPHISVQRELLASAEKLC